MSAKPRRRRLTRAESKAQTRERLLEAAAQVLAHKGYAGASVEEIAETAGYSNGALYSNFAGKEELVIELLTSRSTDQVNAAVEALATIDADEEEPLNALGRVLANATDDGPDTTLLHTELWLYAMRNPSLREPLAEAMRGPHRESTNLMRTALERIGAPPATPPEDVATISMALFNGLVRLRLADPQQVPVELFGRAMQWLFAGIAAAQRDS